MRIELVKKWFFFDGSRTLVLSRDFDLDVLFPSRFTQEYTAFDDIPSRSFWLDSDED